MSFNWRIVLKELIYQIYYYVLGASAILDDIIHSRSNKAVLVTRPGDVAVVTGGARGIGLEVVKCFLKCDMHVIIGCRSVEAGNKAVEAIRSSGATSGTAECFPLDMASFKSVKKFATAVTAKHDKINILVNNAGIMFVPFALTDDGFESHLEVNYLGHCLLTHLLLPQLKAAGRQEGRNSRIVNVSSSAHSAGDINFKDINLKDMYVASEAYAQSKLAQVLFTKKLESLLREGGSPVQTHAVHPGVVDTELFNGTAVKTFFPWVPSLLFKTPQQGANTIVYACLSPSLEGKGGTYLSNCRVISPSAKTGCRITQDRLWDVTRKAIGVHIFGDPEH